MRIFLVGGGSGGPIVPLLAVAEALRKLRPAAKFYFVGENKAFEEKYLQGVNFPLPHLTIPAGKWRRYFSLRNFFDIFKLLAGFLRSFYLLKKYRPDIIFGAGSFVQVPVSWAAFFLRLPVVIHQPDLDVLLSTKLVYPVAKALTVSFFASAKGLPSGTGLFQRSKKSKIVITGNPVRRLILSGSRRQAGKTFGLKEDYPTVLVVGGGRGAEKLNQVVVQALPELVKYVQVIHVTGGRVSEKRLTSLPARGQAHYHVYEFISPEKLADAYARSDLVVSRAGMSAISELAALGKPAILVPLPESPQEDNSRLLAFFRCAVIVFEEFLQAELLLKLVRKILWDGHLQKTLKTNIKKLMPLDADLKIAKLICQIADQKSA